MGNGDVVLEHGVVYPGIDCDWFNYDIMRYLKEKTNLAWCGYYLRVLDFDAEAKEVNPDQRNAFKEYIKVWSETLRQHKHWPGLSR